MSLLDAGFVLLWLGVLMLLAVLVQRVRQGAWEAEAFDSPPPTRPWVRRTAYAGVAIAVAGTVITLWGVL
jgi:hypothetical protein